MPPREPGNRLAAETSLYLRQHATNPVDWYPWSAEALRLAKSLDKPIFLSIGYSACHWCHVMERESFEDEAIARMINDLFIPVKVDREERPDLDNLYMKAVQLLTGRGGWPMSLFLTPDRKPFYAGTYFPPVDRGRLPGFPRVLTAVARAYREDGNRVAASADAIVARLLELERPGVGARVDVRPTLDEAAARLAAHMDPEYGGFGKAPKFPAALALDFLIAWDRDGRAPERIRLARTSLDAMARGGVRDQLGGGFHRYAVDRSWLVPHFEKMLYDQALLANTYAAAAVAYGDGSYRAVSEEILDYVTRELSDPLGGFYTAQDADSEGEEGKYFAWTRAEVVEVVGAADAELVLRHFGVTESGNFEGRNVLHAGTAFSELAAFLGRDANEAGGAIQRARRKLLARRSSRVAPVTDTKVLTDWNGLMIGAMARVGQTFGRRDLVARAARAVDFVRTHLLVERRLKHVYAGDRPRIDGFLDDYAFYGRGCLASYFATGRVSDYETAVMCADEILASFLDEDGCGFYVSRAAGDDAPFRTRNVLDGSVPSGTAVAAELLLRLYQLGGEEAYARVGSDVVATCLSDAGANPYACAQLLCIAEHAERGFGVVVVFDGRGGGGGALADEALSHYAPEVSVLCPGPGGSARLPPVLHGKSSIDGRPTAYLCRGQSCSTPIFTCEDLRAAMGGTPPLEPPA